MLGSNESAGGSDELLNLKACMSTVQGSKASAWGRGRTGEDFSLFKEGARVSLISLASSSHYQVTRFTHKSQAAVTH